MARKTWLIPVDEDGLITIPEDLLDETGWDEGTSLSWEYDEDGSIKLTRSPDDLDTTSPESSS